MNSARDEINELLKDLEFRLRTPLQVRRSLYRMCSVRNPWTPAERELSALFIHIPKTAGTSIRWSLFQEKSYHIPLIRYLAFDPATTQTSLKFCVVRNPWSRLHSAFRYLHRRVGADPTFRDHRWATRHLADVGDFEEFVRRLAADRRFRTTVRRYIHFRDQLDWISTGNAADGSAMNLIVRYESLESDLPLIFKKLGVAVQELPQMRVGEEGDYQDAYDQYTRSVVADVYSRDIRALGYEFGS